MKLIRVHPVEEIKPVEADDVAKVEKDVDGVFKPVSIYLRVSGFYIERSRNKIIRFVEILNSIMTKTLLILNVVRYSTIFLIDTEFGGSLMGSVSLYILYCFAAVLSLALHRPMYRYFKRFVSELKMYIIEYSDSEYLSKAKKRIRILVFTGAFMDLACLLVMSEGIHTVFPSLQRHLTPFQNASGTALIYVMILYAALLLAVGMTLLSTFVLFIIMTYCLKKEFFFFNLAMKEELRKGERNFEAKFDALRKRHEKLCEITETANEIQSHFAAFLYASGIPIVCCLLYGIIKGSLPLDDALFNSWNLLTVVLYIVAVTGMASTLNLWAHEPLQHIFRSNWSLFTEGSLQKITLFVTRLSSEKIGYSVYGLFTIERSTILMVGGTILTYAVVVLQFHPSTIQGGINACMTDKNLNQNLTGPCP